MIMISVQHNRQKSGKSRKPPHTHMNAIIENLSSAAVKLQTIKEKNAITNKINMINVLISLIKRRFNGHTPKNLHIFNNDISFF